MRRAQPPSFQCGDRSAPEAERDATLVGRLPSTLIYGAGSTVGQRPPDVIRTVWNRRAQPPAARSDDKAQNLKKPNATL